MQLVMRPETFDILLLPNLYGDIVSDLAAGLVGGLGIVPGANIGDNHAVFEAVHGSAPDIAGKGIANPTALMLSAVMMLRHIGEVDASVRLQNAIEAVYREGKCITSDVGGAATTSQFTDSVCASLEKLTPVQFQIVGVRSTVFVVNFKDEGIVVRSRWPLHDLYIAAAPQLVYANVHIGARKGRLETRLLPISLLPGDALRPGAIASKHHTNPIVYLSGPAGAAACHATVVPGISRIHR